MALAVHLESMHQCSRGVSFDSKQRKARDVAPNLMCTIVYTATEGDIYIYLICTYIHTYIVSYIT